MKPATLPILALRAIPLFAHFTDDECAQFVQIATEVAYQPGDVILHQREKSQYLWIVQEGECVVVRGPEGDHDEVVLATLGRHDNFGEMSFFHVAPHSVTVRAKAPVRLLRIARSDFDKLIANECAAACKLAYNTVECLADRVRRLNERVARLLTADGGPRRTEEWARFRSQLLQERNL